MCTNFLNHHHDRGCAFQTLLGVSFYRDALETCKERIKFRVMIICRVPPFLIQSKGVLFMQTRFMKTSKLGKEAVSSCTTMLVDTTHDGFYFQVYSKHWPALSASETLASTMIPLHNFLRTSSEEQQVTS